MEENRFLNVEKTVEFHGEKIKKLEGFQETHEDKHEQRDKEHITNTLKLHYIEKGLLSILGIMVAAVVVAVIQLVIKK